MLRDMDFVGCDDSTTEFGPTKSNKADQKIYLAKEFQHSLAPILSWNQWIILPNLLGMHLIFIEKKRWFFTVTRSNQEILMDFRHMIQYPNWITT